jgi:putative restriction endonuclease
MPVFHAEIPPILKHYIDRILQVRRAPYESEGKRYEGRLAPHKPVLLLTLIDWIETNRLSENQILLEDSFLKLFQHNWKLLVDDRPETRYLRPLFHMQTDGFWQLFDRAGRQPESYEEVDSKKRLKEKIAFGRLDNKLFKLLTNPDFRQLIRIAILNHFFEENQSSYLQEHPSDHFDTLQEFEEEVMVLEPKVRYGMRHIEFEGFLRDLAFRKQILRHYGHTCCISGLRIFEDAPIIEAAHIQPLSISGNNHITNGLALCPNLHRAFDYGLISLTDQCEVLLKKGLNENESPYNLRQFAGKRISLPEKEQFFPHPKNLQWHRRQFGFQV